MNIKTHHKINQELCGKPMVIEDGYSRVELITNDFMTVDNSGLVHGGFIFGLADYSAMIAVNDPFVVLGGADVKFLKPSKTGDLLTAVARVSEIKGRKQSVNVTVSVGDIKVFEGTFICFVLEKHVLD